MDEWSVPLRDFIQARHDELIRRLEAQDRVASEIRTEVKTTNGRVTKLETQVAVLNERMPASPKRDIALGSAGAFVAGVGWFLWEKFSK